MVNITVLKQRKDALLRFVKAYRETVETDVHRSEGDGALRGEDEEARDDDPRVGSRRSSRARPCNTDHMADVDASMRDAVALKFIDKPLTKEQLSELIQIPPVAKSAHAQRTGELT